MTHSFGDIGGHFYGDRQVQFDMIDMQCIIETTTGHEFHNDHWRRDTTAHKENHVWMMRLLKVADLSHKKLLCNTWIFQFLHGNTISMPAS